MSLIAQGGGNFFSIRWEGLKRIDFEKKAIRKALRGAGNIVAREQRNLIRRPVRSQPGQPPGLVTGTLLQYVRVRTGMGGWLVRVGSEAPHAHFTIKGTGKRWKKSGNKQYTGVAEPRPFVEKALANRQAKVETLLARALAEALKPVL